MENSTPNVNVMRTEVEACTLKLDIEIPVERVSDVYETTLQAFNRSARVRGFRPGRVPRKILQARFKDDIREEAKRRLFEIGTREAMEAEEIQPETTPRVENEDDVKYVDEQPFVFAVTFDVAPEFETPEYKGIKVSRESSTVEDSSVEEVIDNWLQQRASYEKVDRASAQGDLLKVTYKATLPQDEEAPPETSKFLLEAEETWLALREPELLPGTMTALLHMEAGQEKDVDITFPEEFGESTLAGKTIPYHFTIIEVHAAEVPEFSDDLAKEIGAENADEVRQRVRQNLEADKAQRQDQAVRDQILQTIMARCDFPVPPGLLRRETYDALRRLYEVEMRRGATQEDLQGRQKELMEQAGKLARQQLRQYYVLRRIAELEEIEVTPEEINEAIAGISRSQGVTAKVLLRRLRDSGRIHDVIIGLRESKTISHLTSLADIVDAGQDQE